MLCRASEYRPEGTRITVCTVDEEYVTAFARGVPHQGPHEFNFDDGSLVWPTAIAFDKDWNVYVSDEWLNRISDFQQGWRLYQQVAGAPWQQVTGNSTALLVMAFDADNNVYVVDSGNNRIQKFTKDGQFLAKWGTAGSGDGEFNMPWGIDHRQRRAMSTSPTGAMTASRSSAPMASS